MMNMKKLLALLLAIVMVVGMMPMGVLAEETDPSVPETTTAAQETTVPETTAAAVVTNVEPCTVCNSTECTKTHVQCTTCGNWDCETEHKTCDICSTVDCKATHVQCETCKAWDCKENHETNPSTPATEPSVPETTAPATTDPSTPVTEPSIPVTEPSEPEEITVKAEVNGAEITVEGFLDEGTVLAAAIVAEENYCAGLMEYTTDSAPVFAYDIELQDQDGNAIQPDGEVTVSISVNKADGTAVGILHEHDGYAAPIGMYGDYKVLNGKLTFKTNSFSKFYGYIVNNTAREKDEGKAFTNAAPIIPTEITESAAPILKNIFKKSVNTFTTKSTTSSTAPYAARSSSDSNVVVDKKVTSTGNETWKLTLESYATGESGTVIQVPTPSDIVLVLDESGSMNDCIECNHEIDTNMFPVTVSYKDGNSTKSFVGHIVTGSNVWATQTYRIVYPADKSIRNIFYCAEHDGWYSTGHGSTGKHTGARWKPIAANESPTEVRGEGDTTTEGDWVYNVHFYCVCDHDTERVDALRNALNGFLGQLEANSKGEDGIVGTSDDVNNRIAIVGYGNNSRYYAIPELATDQNPAGKTGNIMNAARDEYTDDATKYAKVALRDILKPNEKNLVENAINAIKSSEPTETHSGVLAAEKIFIENPIAANEDRNRVMILFTDGAPGSGYNNYGPGSIYADWTNPGIKSAYRIKHTYGATVYTVGLFPGADATSTAEYDPTAHGQHNKGFFDNANRVLQLISSNYLNATAVDKDHWGTKNSDLKGKGYYLSTENEQGLYDIFNALSAVAKPGQTTVTLGPNTVVKDVVTPYFTIPDNGANVTAWTESFVGYEADGTTKKWSKNADSVSKEGTGPLTVDVDDRTVTVKNFNFAGEFVHMDYANDGTQIPKGKKLVIEVDIKPNPDFLGGKDVWTNEASSGIYNGDETIETFPRPYVNVSVKGIEPSPNAKDIYVSQMAELPALANIGTYSQNGGTYQVDTINNHFVNIVYTLTDKKTGDTITYTIPAGTASLTGDKWLYNGDLQTTHPFLTDDNNAYTVTITVTEKTVTEGTDNYWSVPMSHDATIHVYKPEITFKDSAINLGDTADYETQNVVNPVVWKHPTLGEATQAMGDAPTLEYSYEPGEAAFTVLRTPVKVTVTSKANGTTVPMDMDITGFVTFWREACDFPNCENMAKTSVSATDANRVNFVVHLKSFDLTITKEVSAEELAKDPGTSFMFRVTDATGKKVSDVVINGSGSVTIKNLPAGVYTVTELTDWSWRYEVDGDAEKEASAADARNGVTTVTFKNQRENIYWVDGETSAKNIFTSVSGN